MRDDAKDDWTNLLNDDELKEYLDSQEYTWEQLYNNVSLALHDTIEYQTLTPFKIIIDTLDKCWFDLSRYEREHIVRAIQDVIYCKVQQYFKDYDITKG